MSKKKSRKKQHFKYGQTQSVASVEQASGAEAKPSTGARVFSKAQQALAGVDDFSYVRADLIRVATLATLCVVLELGLWLAFNKTGLGIRVYSLFKL